MGNTKAAVVVYTIFGKISSIAGYVLAAIGVIGFSAEITNKRESSTVVTAFIFIALGVFLIINGIKSKRRIKRFKQYVTLISTQRITSLDSIAANTSRSVDFVRKDLQKIIDKRFFAHASINAATNEIVIGGMTASPGAAATSWQAQPQQQAQTPQQAQTAAQSEYETFTCPGCGASGAKLRDVPKNCDYCGSLVK